MKYKIPIKAAKTPVQWFPFPDRDFKTLDTLIDLTVSDSDNEEHEIHTGHQNDARSDEEYCSFLPPLQIKGYYFIGYRFSGLLPECGLINLGLLYLYFIFYFIIKIMTMKTINIFYGK
jgi:hypothetical protein